MTTPATIPGTEYGMDVSIYQTPVPIAQGLSFVCVKASQGGGFEDPHWQGWKGYVRQSAAALIAYHFGTNDPVPDQVHWFLKTAPDADAWVLDYESYHDISMQRDQAREFIARVKSSGKPCGMYFNCANYFDAGQDWNWLASPPHYCPSVPYDMLQTRSGVPFGDQASTTSLAKILGGTHPAMKGFTITEDQPHTIALPKGTQLYDTNGRPSHTTGDARVKVGYAKGQLDGDNATYWLTNSSESGAEVLTLVRQKDADDRGPLSGNGGGGGGGKTYQDGFDAAKSKALAALQNL